MGVSIGAFLRDVKRILGPSQTWPILYEIINWERLRVLLQNNENALPNLRRIQIDTLPNLATSCFWVAVSYCDEIR
jgi:hypothetical protein